MVAYNKVNSFVEALAEKVHNLGSDQLAVALCDAAHPPSAATTKLSDLTQISYTNLSSRNITTTSSLQSTGLYKLTLVDLVLLASGGSVAPFRYAVLFNDTAANDEVFGYFDYGSDLTLSSGNSFTVDFDGTGGALTLQ